LKVGVFKGRPVLIFKVKVAANDPFWQILPYKILHFTDYYPENDWNVRCNFFGTAWHQKLV